mmetsp:Transcript_14887/g.28109  ORF Transcript_14887/g.28109 Transcript_14887/m.28109 type:complete len:131 (-) Transcript_14887:1882-2274(-)
MRTSAKIAAVRRRDGAIQKNQIERTISFTKIAHNLQSLEGGGSCIYLSVSHNRTKKHAHTDTATHTHTRSCAASRLLRGFNPHGEHQARRSCMCFHPNLLAAEKFQSRMNTIDACTHKCLQNCRSLLHRL